MHKIIPIEGDLTLPELGLRKSDLNILIDEVSVVFHIAATIKFDEPLKYLIKYISFKFI